VPSPDTHLEATPAALRTLCSWRSAAKGAGRGRPFAADCDPRRIVAAEHGPGVRGLEALGLKLALPNVARVCPDRSIPPTHASFGPEAKPPTLCVVQPSRLLWGGPGGSVPLAGGYRIHDLGGARSGQET
jgi:hypothetical protein